MTAYHQGAAVTVLRDAHRGDSGFGGGMTHVLIRRSDGSEALVPRAELSDAAPPVEAPASVLIHPETLDAHDDALRKGVESTVARRPSPLSALRRARA